VTSQERLAKVEADRVVKETAEAERLAREGERETKTAALRSTNSRADAGGLKVIHRAL
jgi:hypothetical protein